MTIFYTLQPITYNQPVFIEIVLVSMLIGVFFAALGNYALAIFGKIAKVEYLQHRPSRFWVELFFIGCLGWTIIFSYVFNESEKRVVENNTKRVVETRVGTLKGFFGESIKINSKSSSEQHFTYVVYNVDGSDVTFKADLGVPYPEKAIIYRNVK